MKYTERLQRQKHLLKYAHAYAEKIEECDNYIADGYRVDHYRGVREEAIENYAETMKNIVEESVDISIEFENRVHANQFEL